MKFEKFLAIVVIQTTLSAYQTAAFADGSDSLHLRPSMVQPRSNAEYYSASPDSSVAIPVNIWGNVREPGLHYMPLGTNLHQSISAAGGPSDSADMSEVRILRGGKTTYVDLLGPKMVPLQANDYVYVDRSFRADMPLIFAGVSTVLSIATLYFVMNPKK